MDIGAYAQIENDDIQKIIEANGISVPRLRGYRLMSEEKKVNIKDILNGVDYNCADELCDTYPVWNPTMSLFHFNARTQSIRRKYIDTKNRRVKWENIHGKKRKILKTVIHNQSKRYIEQYNMWNKYAGRDDILYVHARIGGGNWPSYSALVKDEPWFIEKVDDAFDSTYCDIYARIKMV